MANNDDWLNDLDSEDPAENIEKDSEEYIEQEKSGKFELFILPFVLLLFVAFNVVFLYRVNNSALPLTIGIFEILFLVIYFPSVNRVFRHITIAFGRNKK